MNAEHKRRYGDIPSTQGGILGELIGDTDTESGTDTRTEERAESPGQTSGVPVPQPPKPTPPREKRTVYLTQELAEVYDDALVQMHGQHRVVKGAVQDAILAVGLLHRDEVEQVLKGER